MIRELFSREAIEKKIGQMGREIAESYRGKDLTVIVLMNGGAFFACDLVRAMDMPIWFDSMRASSYIHDRRCDNVAISDTLKLPVKGRHILLADDIFDSGKTVESCKKYLMDAGALSVKCAVLLNKEVPGRTTQPDWAGFNAPDLYLIGAGLDSEEFYRNLPMVGYIE